MKSGSLVTGRPPSPSVRLVSWLHDCQMTGFRNIDLF
ncbi:unnamed protein product [Rhodiola kirilowii]